MSKSILRQRIAAVVTAIDTTPGTLADDLGCLAALSGLGLITYFLMAL